MEQAFLLIHPQQGLLWPEGVLSTPADFLPTLGTSFALGAKVFAGNIVCGVLCNSHAVRPTWIGWDSRKDSKHHLTCYTW